MSKRLFLSRPSNEELELVQEILDTLNECRAEIESDSESTEFMKLGAGFVEECIVGKLCDLGFAVIDDEPTSDTTNGATGLDVASTC